MSVRKRKVMALGGGAVAAAAAPLMVAGQVEAASFEVTNLDDSGPGSLRQAILDANAAGGADVITFQSSLSGTIVLTTGQLEINDSVDIQGPGAAAITVSGNDASRVFYLYANTATIDIAISGLTIADGAANIGAGILNFDENLTLTNVVVSGNAATGDGGGIWTDGFNHTFTITDSLVTGNSAGADGGGMYVEDTGGTFTIDGTTFSLNTAVDDGGGIYLYDPDTDVNIVESTFSGNSAGDDGGGIYLYDTDGGTFTIDRTTISGNSATDGGGLFLYGADNPLNVVNSTISGNTATGAGGGLFLYETYDNVLVSHSTIAGNTAATGGNISANDSFAMEHTVVADGTATTSPEIDMSSTLYADFSLIEDDTSLTIVGADNIVDTDPQLGALQNNGGVTFTMLPAATSPVVDAGDAAFAPPPATDQRGVTRVLGAAVDIGAVETGGPVDDVGVTAEDTPLVVAAPGVLANDPTGVTVVPTLGTLPLHGTVVFNADGSYTYTPTANSHGPDSFTYTLSVNGVALGSATVAITVTPVVDPPVAVNDTAVAQVGGQVTVTVLGNDTAPDGGTLTITGVTQGAKGTVTIVGGTVVYRPNLSASGTDSFTYTISDGTSSATATVQVTLIPGQIPATGGGSLPIAALAAGLLVAGSALTFTPRRQRRSTSTN